MINYYFCRGAMISIVFAAHRKTVNGYYMRVVWRANRLGILRALTIILTIIDGYEYNT
jgi:hypothetical protein